MKLLDGQYLEHEEPTTVKFCCSNTTNYTTTTTTTTTDELSPCLLLHNNNNNNNNNKDSDACSSASIDSRDDKNKYYEEEEAPPLTLEPSYSSDSNDNIENTAAYYCERDGRLNESCQGKDDTEEEDGVTTTTVTASASRRLSVVRFGTVQVRHFAMRLGDNPSVRSGYIPIALCYKDESLVAEETLPLDCYEQRVGRLQPMPSSNAVAGGGGGARAFTKKERWHMLKSASVSKEEVVENQKTIDKIQQQRMATYRMVQRRDAVSKVVQKLRPLGGVGVGVVSSNHNNKQQIHQRQRRQQPLSRLHQQTKHQISASVVLPTKKKKSTNNSNKANRPTRTYADI